MPAMRSVLSSGLVLMLMPLGQACVGGLTDTQPLPTPGNSSPSDAAPDGNHDARDASAEPPDDDATGGPSCTTGEVGRLPARLLTREQLGRLVESAFLPIPLDGKALVAELPAPSSFAGFNNNANRNLSQSELEQLLDVAESVADAVLPELQSLVACQPSASCAQALAKKVGRRAFRRSLRPDDLTAFEALFASAENPVRGMRQTIIGILASPETLYQTEIGVPTSQGARALTGPEIAQKLAFFLWDSVPDDALLDLAESGALEDRSVRRREVERMLDDPKSAVALAEFHRTWLDLDRLDEQSKDASLFPSYTSRSATDALAETSAFVDYVIRVGDGKLQTLLTAPFSFASTDLLERYGAQVDPAKETHQGLARIVLDPKHRAGLLTQAAFLSRFAHANQTSPTLRGLAIRRSLLCQTIPDPPPTVNADPPELDPSLPTRERYAAHREDPSCAGCHNLMDPIGLGFEHFDAIGSYRDFEGKKLPIDASGEVAPMTADGRLDGDFDGALELSAKLAQSDTVRSCVTENWLRFALARDTASDACSVDTAYAAFKESDFDLRALILAITDTPAFATRQN